MKTKRAISIGVAIWFLAVFAFTLSFYIPLLEDYELQANLVVGLVLIPLTWFGAHLYYRAEQKSPGLKIGLAMLLTGVILDATVTVPLLVIPAGGSYYQFFTDISFWIIAILYLSVVSLYHRIKMSKA
ncbi:DUF5367 family protein [Lentiprolixibacter aurantiacus]|uniref:DUF5367 family protein n=1 Tax=Lentiprolixibacter aurantiacus TaxID=2993939 RepID=A0AAE3MJV7_9FLAO|nr:DUF5367 family protein [Lentiprolixibacter aurantiacus]MCX2718803.1 DUF5367 family protein [Lentiprolixibacter aurantiacus]